MKTSSDNGTATNHAPVTTGTSITQSTAQSTDPAKTLILRGHVITPLRGESHEFADISDGVVVVKNGKIEALGSAEDILASAKQTWPHADIVDHRPHLLLPGFVDCHVHYPQIEMIASPGLELLEWLENYTFPTELKFAQRAHCDSVADFFTDQLIAHGVTTACVYSTVHKQSADALFSQAQRKNLRIITGKVCMDRNAPEELLDTPESAVEDSRELIEKWHGVDRLEYAITPRFAPTSSDKQLQLLGKLAAEYTVVIQTHLSENKGECQWVKELFPGCEDYTAVYENAGLVRRRSVFGHGIYLSDSEVERLGAARASIAHCPTSNFFLGSGIFPWREITSRGASGPFVGLGSDVGAGTSLSPLASLGGAYKASRMVGAPMTAFDALRLATLGGAEALGLECVGTLEAGMDADIVVIDPTSSAVLERRVQCAQSTEEMLFAIMTLGDDRTVAHTYVASA